MHAGAAAVSLSPLDGLHRAVGARMTAFAGYVLPLHYAPGILAEHIHTRSAASLFDVSHMGQVEVRGPDVAAALERLLPTDVLGLKPGRSRYTLLTNARGGVVDDLLVGNTGHSYYLVVNAARRSEDLSVLRNGAPDLQLELHAERALLALQGPAAATVLAALVPAVAGLPFMGGGAFVVAGAATWITRSGYTGEDGFELSLMADQAEAVARTLLADPRVRPAGLGARDSLRLEAGLCLYGHELNDTTSPVEAGLDWTIPRVRRLGGARAGGFPGAERIFAELTQGPTRRRVGVQPEGRAPVRDGAVLRDAGQRVVGEITSGGYGPSVGAPIAMGYVLADAATVGALLYADVRGQRAPVRVMPLPFMPHRYYR